MTSDAAAARPSRDDPAALLLRFREVLPSDVRAAARIAVRVVRAARETGDKVHELRGYWALSSAAALARRPRAVLWIIERALACDAARDDEALRARTTLGRGSSLVHFGLLDELRRDVDAALPVLERAGDRRGQAAAHGLLAQAAAEAGRHAEAVGHRIEQRAALGPDAAPFALAAIEQSEANSRVRLFEFVDALRLFESARARFESVGAHAEAALSLFNCAYLHLKSGRYADALRLHARAETELRAESNDALLRALCIDRAELLLTIGAADDARRWTTKAVAAAGDALSIKDKLRARQFLAAAALQEGDADAAGRMAAAAADDCLRAGDRCGAAECFVIRSSSELASGRADGALDCALSAAAQFDETGAGAAACDADFAECRAHLALGDLGRAERAVARASSRRGFDALPWAAIEHDRHRAMVRRARGDDSAAADLLDAAVRSLDARRALLPPDALRSAFLSLHAPLYREAVGAHARLGRVERAFELAAASKSRALLDLMVGGARIDDADAGRLDRLRAELGGAYARLHAMSLRPSGSDEVAAAHDDTTRIEQEMSELVAQSLSADGGGGTSRPPQTADELRGCVAADEALVEYAFGDGVLHAFVVTRGAVRRVGLDVAPAWVAARASKFAFHVSEAALDGPPRAEALEAARSNLAELYRRIVEPLGLPRDATRVVVAPDGPLHRVPFHAMPVADAWWADDVQVQYAPSALVHASCLRPRPRAAGPPHVFAVPDDGVPAIRSEAAFVAAAFGSRAVVRMDGAATWSAFVDSAREAGLLHVATHGISRSDSIVGGSVRLADGWLTPFDLYRTPVRARLVVLSACDSGAERLERSGDAFGLPRGFLCAGARTVVASRWRVDDRTTAEWMRAFYGALAAGGSAGGAYAAACGAVRAARPHPFHWAPFVLTGDPRSTYSS